MTATVYTAFQNSDIAGTMPAGVVAARTSFLAAITSPQSYNFEANFSGDTPTLMGPMAFGSGPTAVNATISGPAPGATTPVIVASSAVGGRYNTSGTGTNYLRVRALVGDYVQFAFDTSISAFGFYATDVGDFGGLLDCVLTRSGGGTDTFTIRDDTATPAASGNGLFWGVVDPAARWTVAKLVLTNGSSATDYFGFDDFVIAVPSQVASSDVTLTLSGSSVAASSGTFARGFTLPLVSGSITSYSGRLAALTSGGIKKLPTWYYVPGPIPATAEPWVRREFERVSQATYAAAPFVQYQVAHREPEKPSVGMSVHADGTDWDPGSGEGLYVYKSTGAWAFLG